MHDYTALTFDEMETAFGGVWIRARASLGASAFGLQVTTLPPDSGDMYPAHTHNHDGQEEIYLLLDGAAEMELPDASVTMDRETMIRVGPTTPRRIRSGPAGCRFLIIGATPGQGYTPPPETELGGPETLDESALVESVQA